MNFHVLDAMQLHTPKPLCLISEVQRNILYYDQGGIFTLTQLTYVKECNFTGLGGVEWWKFLELVYVGSRLS